ncbi:reverse transcriptase domain-containing protein [Tanacetum coccineum]|uniref:Reverse transcriptase domain-containing protein n=1 Tax=Tanacetum coccineum TaxID=301880 RepID=A0ABQ4Y3D4_9ASTR
MVKSWLVQDQTVLGKDYSNLLIADSLLKTIWFINAPCYGNEALASPKANELTIPEQTATGKGKSNPFMAGSLPKTTKPTMAPKRISTSAAPAMTHAVIRKLVADSVATALEAQAANMANTDNTNRNPKPREDPIARKSESVFLRSNYTEDCKVKFATGTLTEEALSWWNSFAQPIGIEEAYKITWSKFKTLLIKKYYPRTEVKKMEDEFYNLTLKGSDLKMYIRRFQELETLCPTMVPNSKKTMEVFIEGLPRSIEGNVTALKPQTLEEAITITQRLMDQVTKHNSVQGTNV